jgi:hypothetical protein
MRTKRSSVTFLRPFKLDGFTEALPPGTYAILTEEEETDTMLSAGWRRVSTTFCTPSIGSPGHMEQWTSINARDLEAALQRDSANRGR